MAQQQLSVLQILPALDSGGVERGTLEVAAELARQGHRSLVISAGGKLVDQLCAEGSQHISWPIGKKSPLTLRHVLRLRRLLRDQQIDIVHARSRVPAWVTWLAWRWMDPMQRPRFVTTVHGLYSVNAYSSIMMRGERVIAISQTVRRYVLDNYPFVDRDRLPRIYRGVDGDDFPYGYRPSQQWLDRWHEQYPQLKGQRVITLPGRLTRYKGHTDFIRLMARLRERWPQTCGLIVGAEDPRRRAYADQMRKLVADYGLDNIIFTGHRSDMREIYAASDMVLSVSSQPPEAFGRTVLEALKMGVPVVGYDQSGAGEVIEQIFPEGVVPAGNLDALTDRVIKFLDNPPSVSKSTQFTRAEMVEKTLTLYQELAAQRLQHRVRTHVAHPPPHGPMLAGQPRGQNSDRPLRVWVLSDGSPGHFNQSRGVVKALEQRRPVETHWIDVKLRSAICRRLLTWLLNKTPASLPPRLLHAFYRISSHDIEQPSPDLILSAGGNTLFANAWLARSCGCRNIFVGSVRRLADRNFSLIITYDERKASQPNCLLSLTPTAIDPREVTQAGRQYRTDRGLGDQRVWTMLIGGDGGGYRYDRRDWHELADAMRAISQSQNIQWLVTTSRRTGQDAEDLLAAQLSRDVAEDIVIYSQDKRSVINSLLGAAEAVFCTEDSAMMITEAVSAMRPVYTLRPRNAKPDKTNLMFLRMYEDRRYIKRLKIRNLAGYNFSQPAQLQSMETPPLENLARQLEQWLGSETISDTMGSRAA